MNTVTKAALTLIIAFFAGVLILTALPTYNYLQASLGALIGIVGFWVVGKGRKDRREKLRVAYDFITVTLMGVFFLAIIFGGLGGIVANSQPSINLAQFLISFWAGGVIMSFVSGVLAFHSEIGKKLFSRGLVYLAMSFGVFFLVNIAIPPTVPLFFKQSVLTPQGNLSSSGKLITTIISVPEETVFRGWLAPWLGNISHSGLLGGAIGSAILFTVYHLYVYGTIPANLIIVFADGLVQGFVALKSGILGFTVASHLTNNFISVGGFSPSP